MPSRVQKTVRLTQSGHFHRCWVETLRYAQGDAQVGELERWLSGKERTKKLRALRVSVVKIPPSH